MGDPSPSRLGATVGRACLGLAAVAWLVLTVSTLPGVRDSPGFVVLFDGWVQCTGYVFTALAVCLRVVTRSDHRLLWSLVAAALVLRSFAFVWLIAVLPRPQPYPSLSDACWLLSGLLLIAAVWVLARIQLSRLSTTLLLDAVLGGLTATAVTLALLYPTLVLLTAPGIPGEVVATNVAYPLIDVAQLMLVAGLLATQRRVAPAVASMSVGLVALAVVDTVFLYLVAVGDYAPGSFLPPLSLGGTGMVALAAWLPITRRERVRPEGAAVLALPAALALACVGVLVYGATRAVALPAQEFAAAGIVIAMVRAYVTLSADRRDASVDLAVKQRELERFQALVAASSDFIAIADSSRRLVYLNPGGRRLVGISPDADVSQTSVRDFLTPEGLRLWQEVRYPEILARGRWDGESALQPQGGGAPIPMATSTFTIKDPEGGRTLIATVQRDISERRAAEQELVRFSALVGASSDFIAIAGVDGQVHYVNPAGRELVGMDPDADATTTSITDFLTEEGIRASIEVEQPAVVAHGHWEGESTLRDLRGGPPTPVAINSFLIRHPDTGDPWLLATVQRDLSERVAAEASLQELADQRQLLLGRLVEAQEDERARIAADVHDDSVQALAAVELRLLLVLRGLTDSQPELLGKVETLQETVRGATERLRHLLFDLESPARSTDLASALEEAAAYVFEDSLRWQVAGEDGGILTTAGRVTVYRVAKEAMVNVHKHARAQHVSVEVHPRDGGVEVSIVDDGTGFDVDSVDRRPGHLGIAGMHDRVTVAGGSLRIESHEGGGTTVRIWVPAEADAAV